MFQVIYAASLYAELRETVDVLMMRVEAQLLAAARPETSLKDPRSRMSQ